MRRKFILVVMVVSLFIGVEQACALNNATLQQWGTESMAELKTDFKLSGNLYAQSLTERWPSYAWGQGIMLTALVAAAKVNPGYLNETRAMADEFHTRFRCYANGIYGYNASAGSCGDRYYDDNAWIALGLVELYEITREPKYLNRAMELVTFCMSGENGPGDVPDGGIRWHESNTGGASVCSTAPTILANLMLYQLTGIDSYKTDGLRLYQWLSTSNLRYASGIYHETNQGPLGYQTAVVLQGAVRLYHITGNTPYLTEAQRLAAAMQHEFTNRNTGELEQTGKWGGHDMTNAYVDLYQADGNRHWLNVAAGYIEFLHVHCKDAVTGRYPTSWNNVAGAPSAELIDNASVARACWKLATTLGGDTPVYLNILNRASARCMRTYNSGSADNTNIVLYDRDTTWTSELFTLVDLGNGYYNIRSLQGDKALQPYNNLSANNTNVVIYTANAAHLSQQWSLLDAGSGYFNIQNRLTGKSIQPYNSATGNNVAAVTYTTNVGLQSQQWQFTGLAVPLSITPALSVNGDSWEPLDHAALNTGDDISLRGQAVGSGTWTWTGPGGFTAATSEIAIENIQPSQAGSYYVTFTNSGNTESYAAFDIRVRTGVELFQHCDYTGWKTRFGPGTYTTADIAAAGGINNDASSLRIEPGYKATFYDYDNFQGAALVKTANDTCLVDDGWNDRLSSMIIEQLSTPVAYWRFNETGGTTANDASGYGHSGTLMNMDAASRVTGKQCGGLSFDGTNDHVKVAAFTGVSGQSSRTCSVWIKTTRASGGILTWGAAVSGQKWNFAVDGRGGLGVEVQDGYICSSSIIADGEWHHVAAVLENDGTPDVSEVKLYVDGLLETPALVVPRQINTADWQRVLLGCLPNGTGFYFQGQMDEALIYSRALTDAEIWSIYETHALAGDSEPDGDLDMADFAAFSDHWQKTGGSPADLTCDGTTDLNDFLILIDEWLTSLY